MNFSKTLTGWLQAVYVQFIREVQTQVDRFASFDRLGSQSIQLTFWIAARRHQGKIADPFSRGTQSDSRSNSHRPRLVSCHAGAR